MSAPKQKTRQPKAAPPSLSATERRRAAEQRLCEQPAAFATVHGESDARRVAHELQIHQLELEMQNEELQLARDALAAGLEKYTELYDFAPVGYVTLDRQGTIRGANLAASALLGIERARIIQQPLRLMVAPADRRSFDAFLQRMASSGTREACEVGLQPDGKPAIPARIEGVRAAAGEEVWLTIADVTERISAEQNRLILGKLESTGVLAGGLAHDFNNLLTVILLGLEQAQTFAASGSDLLRFLADARSAALSARDLTSQLLSFARGGAPDRRPLVAQTLIMDSAHLALSGSRIRCVFVLPEDLWLLHADEGQIGQVVRNLVWNAREALGDSGKISIRAENIVLADRERSSLPAGRYVRVSISDRGAGIAPEVLARVFDPYFSTKQRGTVKGMGLGLTICHAIVRSHGGEIAVHSEAGVGTTFQFHLPASESVRAPAVPLGPTIPPSRAHILVMDDDAAVGRAIEDTLRRMDHAPQFVDDGVKAIEVYREAMAEGRPFDLILLDLTVRGGAGAKEVLQGLLEIDPAVKAVVMTGFADDPVARQPEDHGFKAALAKPFARDTLQRTLARVLGGCCQPR